MIPPLSFERLNETDIREEVIAPLLRRLGYSSGTTNDVIREQSLRYPNLSLGRKDPKKDPELRGKADYILEVSKRLRWVVEAKAPQVEIGINEIEQAWSYANHPEVRAIYFVLCNGRTLSVYRTAHGPQAEAVLSLTYERFDQDFQLLENLLGPAAMTRDFPHVELDVGVPIAPGLRSLARITNGVIRYEKNSLNLTVLSELQTGIRDGAVERDESGRLIAYLKTAGPSRSLQELNERLGLSTFEMKSDDAQLSGDPARPTAFIYQNRVTLPAGERILDLSTWKEVQLPVNVSCDVHAEARGIYRDRTFSGTFATRMEYQGSGAVITMSGTFEVYLT